MFRRLYWITEQVEDSGKSRVTGVYTSIQDLVHNGLHWCEDLQGQNYRLTLVKPDTFNKPLGVWSSPHFDGLADDIRNFVETHEYSEEETQLLTTELHNFIH